MAAQSARTLKQEIDEIRERSPLVADLLDKAQRVIDRYHPHV